MKGKSVLLVVPDNGLPMAGEEARAISLALDSTVLSGVVTRADLINALPAKPWDILWFVTHGSVDGIMLSDGTIGAGDLAAIVGNTQASLVVLNTCDTRLVGLDIHYELGVDVITTVAEVTDATAYQAGVLLARNLGGGMSNREAFERSKPSNSRNYHIFSGDTPGYADDNATIIMMNEVLSMWGNRLSAQIHDVEKRTSSEIDGIRKDIMDMRAAVNNSVALPPWYRVAFTAAFALLFVPTLLYYYEVRQAIGIQWQAAIAFTALSYSGSATMWAYMWWGSKGDKR